MEQRRTELIEEGDIFFFYRPRLDVEEVQGRKEIQRFYLVLAPETPKKLYRLFVVGRKKLPEITSGKRDGERRNWALNVLTTKDPKSLRSELMGAEYETKTRGERRTHAATPLGEGKYQILWHKDHTEIAYALELPKETGEIQQELGIQEQASYILAVKNPDVSIPGFPAPKNAPEYSSNLKAKFGNRRWIDADDPALLDEEHTQLLLIGARAEDVQQDLGIEIKTEEETLRTSELCRKLKLSCDEKAVAPLFGGDLPIKEEPPKNEEIKRLPSERSPSKA